MYELFQTILTEIRGAWRFRWLAMGIAWVVCIVGWPAVFMLSDQFESEARFYVDTTTRLDEVMGGVIIAADERSQIELVRQAMLSSPVLEKVARETDLDLRATTAIEKQELIEELQRKIRIGSTSVQRNRDDGIYWIKYRDVQMDKSLAVVDQLLDSFREDVISGRTEGSDETVEFLRREIDEYGTSLRGQEQRIAEFKKNNVGLLPGESGGYFERMQQIMVDARSLEAEMSVLADRRRTLNAQLSSENPVMPSDPGFNSGGSPQSDIDVRIEELETSIEEMLTRYTEKWPDVIAARSQLEQLQQRREVELAEFAAAGGEELSVASNNPVYQQIQIALNDTNVEIAALERQIADRRGQIADLQARVDVIPEVEAELAQLTRDYEQVRAVYGQLRERLEQEELRRKRIGWNGVTFRIIDPPRVDLEPVSPQRTRLLIMVLIGGLIAGGGIAYLMQQLRPVFIDAATLRRVTGLPVLGSVSMTFMSKHRVQRRKELMVLLSSAAVMLVFLAVVLFFEDTGIQTGVNIRRAIML